MRTLHTSARPVSRQGTVIYDPRVPATLRVPLRCVRYYDAKIRLRSTKTLCRAGSGVAHSGGLCTLDAMHAHSMCVRLSGSLAYPDILVENGCVWLSEVDCIILFRRSGSLSGCYFPLLLKHTHTHNEASQNNEATEPRPLGIIGLRHTYHD